MKIKPNTQFQKYLLKNIHICLACSRFIKNRGWAMHLKGQKHKENLKPLEFTNLFG